MTENLFGTEFGILGRLAGGDMSIFVVTSNFSELYNRLHGNYAFSHYSNGFFFHFGGSKEQFGIN